jgi:hypothetical protein
MDSFKIQFVCLKYKILSRKVASSVFTVKPKNDQLVCFVFLFLDPSLNKEHFVSLAKQSELCLLTLDFFLITNRRNL